MDSGHRTLNGRRIGGRDDDGPGPAVLPLPPLAAPPRRALYFQRVLLDGAKMELCIAGHEADPNQTVSHVDKNQKRRFWEKYTEGPLLVFRSPSDWDGAALLCWQYDPWLQRTERMPDKEAERAAVRYKVTA